MGELAIFLTDILSGINIVLIFGSVFLALEIVRYLGMKESYVLAKGWKYVLPAVFVLAIIRVYDFFVQYSSYSNSRFAQEIMYFLFNAFLFAGLMVQFLAIKRVTEDRR